MSNYTLDVISHHPKFDSKSLKKYYVDGIETVGAWGDEPFEICFKNNTWNKVQVKLSVDGTDVLSGKTATTDVDNNMWVVNGYGTLSLKAWPETNNGGAAFVFTSANNSVAIHTHGDLSSRGIIAAAVYVEGHVEPVRLTWNPPTEVHHHHHYRERQKSVDTWYGPVWVGGYAGINGTFGGHTSNVIPASYNNSCTLNSDKIGASLNDGSATYDSCEIGESEPTRSLESLVSVGAGQHVDQKITYVSGLIKPTLSETVRVRYMWYDDMVTKLKANTAAAPHPSGFPGDKSRGINLGKTPRIGSFKRTEQPEVSYSRF